MSKKEAVNELLLEYGIHDPDFPQPIGCWHAPDDTDPPWERSTLKAAQEQGLIVLDVGKQFKGGYRWAFTLKASKKRIALIKPHK